MPKNLETRHLQFVFLKLKTLCNKYIYKYINIYIYKYI